MTRKPNRTYSKGFKLVAVSLVIEQGYHRVDAAKSLGIDARLISRWIQEYEKNEEGDACRGQGKLTAEQEAIGPLKEENRRLKMEKDILKKTTAFFVKETS